MLDGQKGMSEFRHIVRVVGVDMDGTLNVAYALHKIKGINIRLAYMILRKSNIKPETRMGFLAEKDLEKIEYMIKNLEKVELPSWLLNRRKDAETGKDTHLIGSDLDLKIKSDIETQKNLKSWRGYRYAYGLKVRGQRTKTTGRNKKNVTHRKKRG